MKGNIPLFVDLDRALCRNDLLAEASIRLMLSRPWKLFRILKAFCRGGIAEAKLSLSTEILPDFGVLPLQEEAISLIRESRAAGREVVLATASSEEYARKVADHLDLFDRVIASSETVNLKGDRKLSAIEEITLEMGASGFDYIGDSTSDIPVFQQARRAYAVVRSSAFEKRLKRRLSNIHILARVSSAKSGIFPLLRPHHWSKNILVFLPVLLAHEWMDPVTVVKTTIAFVLFCIMASSVYLLNDISDIEKDRRHPSKQNRPLASGLVPAWLAALMMAVLVSLGCIGSLLLLNTSVFIILILYFIANIAYSFHFKKVAVLDIIILTLMYLSRILAGGAAADVEVSDWLLSFGLFLFLSLSMAKRFQEAVGLSDDDRLPRNGRPYMRTDLPILAAGGLTSGLLTVLVLALYIRSPEVKILYEDARLLWGLCPVFLYWITRFWLVTFREEMDDDPIVFVIKDKISYLVAGIAAALVLFAHSGTLILP